MRRLTSIRPALGVVDTRTAQPAMDRVTLSASKRGYDRAWRRFREQVLADEPLCRRCTTKGKVEPATEVHHVVPIAVDPSRRLDRTNVEALCHPCHSAHTAAEQGGQGPAAR